MGVEFPSAYHLERPMNFPDVLDAFSFLDRHCIFKTCESNLLRRQCKNAQYWGGLRWITTPWAQHADDSYWNVKSCSIEIKFAHIRWPILPFEGHIGVCLQYTFLLKEMGVQGRSPRKKNRVDKTFICGLEWNFLSRASEPSASRKKNVGLDVCVRRTDKFLLTRSNIIYTC